MTPLCVPPDKIDEIWPHVRALIDMAFWYGRGDDSPDIIYKDLKAEGHHTLLWVVLDDENKQIVCAVTTKLVMTERGKVCLITSCGGNSIERWFKFLKNIETYAKAEGCETIRLNGRRGWIFYFKDRGYDEPWVVLEKNL